MATKLYFITGVVANYGLATNTAKADGSTSGWFPRRLRDTPELNLDTWTTNTVAGPTNGVEAVDLENVSGLTLPMEFFTEPLAADITISGTVTMNIWASEGNMAANVAPQVIIERVDAVGGLTTILNSQGPSEVSVGTPAVNNWTGTPTSTNMKKGDRIRARILGNDAGTMASGHTFSIYAADDVADANGDTWIQFNENLTFDATTPSGATLYLTDTVSDVATANDDKEAWTSRGSSSVTAVTNTVDGWTNPIHVTKTAGGTAVDWYTKRLNSFTLGGRVSARINIKESSLSANAGMRLEIAICDADGANAVVWAAASIRQETTTTDTNAETPQLVGPDTSVAEGKRLRIRVFVDDISAQPLVTGHTVTVNYSGPTDFAAGDTRVTLTQTVTEFTAAPDNWSPSLARPRFAAGQSARLRR